MSTQRDWHCLLLLNTGTATRAEQIVCQSTREPVPSGCQARRSRPLFGDGCYSGRFQPFTCSRRDTQRHLRSQESRSLWRYSASCWSRGSSSSPSGPRRRAIRNSSRGRSSFRGRHRHPCHLPVRGLAQPNTCRHAAPTDRREVRRGFVRPRPACYSAPSSDIRPPGRRAKRFAST